MAEHGDVATGPGWELRCGRWQDVLSDVTECDACVTDPPYSERTHSGHDGGTAAANRLSDGVPWVRNTHSRTDVACVRRAINYDAWTSDDVCEFVDRWGTAARGWMVCQTSHDLIAEYAQAMEEVGRYAFHPIPAVITGMTVRLGGDGPSSWAVYNVVSRTKTREMQRWGTLPGAYVGGPEKGTVVVGGKPLWLMRAIVRDYSRPGDLIVDPCAGGGTTLLAAVMEGRRAIGAEMDPDTFDKAVARLRKGYTPTLRFDAPETPEAEQTEMFG